MIVNNLGEKISMSGQVDSTFRMGPIELVGIQPTRFCNINCSYCFLPEEDRASSKKITLETVSLIGERIFNSGLVRGPFTIAWAAGEPLSLKPEFYEQAFQEIQKHNKSNTKIIWSFTTNATLMTEEWCEFFLKHKVLLAVSADGPKFLHDACRVTRTGQGTFDRVFKGLELLRKYKVPFATISVLSDRSLDYPDELYDFYRHAGIRGTSFNYDEVDGANMKSSMNYEGVGERYERFLRRLYDVVRGDGNRVWVREFDEARSFFRAEEIERMKGGSLNLAPNNQYVIPFAVLTFDCEGGFTTFGHEIIRMKNQKHGDFYLGRVQDGPIQDVIHTDKFKDIWRDVAGGVRACEKSCAYFAFCGGGSPSNKYLENGTCDSTETLHCRLTVQARVHVVQRKILGAMQEAVSPSPQEVSV